MVSLKSGLLVAAQLLSVLAVKITVKSSGGNATSGHQYGFLHEDINNSGDGGIYAELIRNRAFQYSKEYPLSLDAWHPIGGAKLELNRHDDKPLSKALPASMCVSAGKGKGKGKDKGAAGRENEKDKKKKKHKKQIGFYNDGYWGMDVKKQTYTGSFWVKGAYKGVFEASLRSNLTDDVFGSVEIKSKAKAHKWVEHEFELVPKKDAPNSNNTFAITFNPSGCSGESLDFNLISLFPPTYKNRKNGLRVDIAESLAELHPTLIRVPGGNMLEGGDNKTRWDWKDSLGPLKDRPGFPGVWGYQQTHGLGLMEYLEWADDMGLDPVIAVWAGLALNGDVTPKDKLQPFIDDALDEIEFIVGSVDTKWGAKRAELGHPEPFNLQWVEVGNEDWLAGGDLGWNSYKEYRLPMFKAAINAAYPDITVIASGASTDNITLPKDVLGDYHPYREPDALVEEFDRFDNDVAHIVGEVAATHVNGGIGFDGDLQPFPWWIGTVGEAVSLIGYERNCDRVPGAFYAPVLRNMNRWQWAVTLVQFAADPAITTRSTSWYVWELFAAHVMTNTLPAKSNHGFDPVYFVAGENADTGSHILKIAAYNTTKGHDVPVSVSFGGVKGGAKAALTMLTNPGGDPFAYNDPLTGVDVVDRSTVVIEAGYDGAFQFSMPQLSVAVLDTDYKTYGDEREKRTTGRRM